jgi:cell division protein FtsI (penicillin-binding protein 3)
VVPTTGRHDASFVHDRRLKVALYVGLAAWVVVVARLVMIQVVHSPRLAAFAERQHVERVRLAPERGIIYDRNLVPLCDNLTVRSVCAYPGDVKSPGRVARSLASVLGGSSDQYASLLRSKKAFVWIERQVTPAEARALEEMELPGIGFHKENKRVYPFGEVGCHVVGMTDLDGQGISGIESQLDAELAGADVWVSYFLDSVGRRMATPAGTKVESRDGASAVLTIDIDLQSIAEVELERAVRENEAKGGTIIIQDPWTGEILAMANWPRFDPNSPQNCPVQNQKNRAITDQYEPGSVFKLVTACAALSTGTADLSSVYYANRGEKSFGSCRIHDCHDGGYGWLDFTGAFAKSSNVCFAQIAEDVGSVPLYAYARDFGFGCPTGIALPGEVRGLLREPAGWSRRSIHTIGIGQEVAVTSLQMVSAYSAVANGGSLMEPRIVRAVIGEDGRVLDAPEPAVVREVVSPEVAAIVRDLMVSVTECGTGVKAAVSELTVAGKTGTAQKALPNGRGYSSDGAMSSFAGFAPADAPEIVCLVVIDEPEGRGLAGDVAAPVFGRIVERIVRGPGRQDLIASGVRGHGAPQPRVGAQYAQGAFAGDGQGAPAALNVPARHEAAYASYISAPSREPVDALARASAGVTSELVVNPGQRPDALEAPDLRGMSIRLARKTASASGLVLAFEGSGVVQEQSPLPGSLVRAGDRVVVTCSL